MRRLSSACFTILIMIAAVAGADKSDVSDSAKRRSSRDQPRIDTTRLPQPLQAFDTDGDNALSPDEIESLAERIGQLDRDGDGRVDPMELREIFMLRRARDRGEARFEDGDFDRGEFDDRFDRGPREGRRPGPPERGRDRFEDGDFDRGEFDDRFDRGPGEGRRPGPPDRGRNRFEDDGLNSQPDPGSRSERSRQDRGEENRIQDERERYFNRINRMIDQLYRFDANGDGSLTAEELPPRAKRLIDEADRDQSGSIGRDELEMFLQQQ